MNYFELIHITIFFIVLYNTIRCQITTDLKLKELKNHLKKKNQLDSYIKIKSIDPTECKSFNEFLSKEKLQEQIISNNTIELNEQLNSYINLEINRRKWYLETGVFAIVSNFIIYL